jgi:hypothetical protein
MDCFCLLNRSILFLPIFWMANLPCILAAFDYFGSLFYSISKQIFVRAILGRIVRLASVQFVAFEVEVRG